MAYRAILEKPQEIRALVSSTNIVVADVQLTKAQVTVSQPKYYIGEITSQFINALATYANPTTEIHYQNLKASDVVLDPYSLNRYFRSGDFATLLDAPALHSTKGVDDTVALSEQLIAQLDKDFADSVIIGDVFEYLLVIQRAFADSAAVIDAAPVLTVTLPKTDTFSASDEATRSFDKGLADTPTISEAYAASITKSPLETVSLSETFAKTVSFVRSFSDSFTLDDFSNVNAIRKDTLAAKTNVVSFADVQTLSTEKALDDTATINEQAALDVTKPFTDGFSTGDVFQRTVTFSRAHTDSVSVTEAQTTTFDKAATDATFLSDSFQATTAFARTFADAVSFAEQTTAAFEKALSDTATLSESIQITTSSTASAVLNASALNSVPLNN